MSRPPASRAADGDRPETPEALGCRVLPFGSADGPTNMALDQALLEECATTGVPVIRTYGWSEPTLSLGYFQPSSAYLDDARWRGVAVVRRQTGGGAIWHHHDLTYSLVIPGDHPYARQAPTLYRTVHAAIAAVIRELGPPVGRRGDSAPVDGPGRARPFLCFAGRDAEDLVIEGIKVVGSAQRRRAGVVLQHGSLLLATSPVTPELVGLATFTAANADPAAWSARLLRSIPEALGLAPEPSDWSPSTLSRAREIAEEVYRNPDWTNRR